MTTPGAPGHGDVGVLGQCPMALPCTDRVRADSRQAQPEAKRRIGAAPRLARQLQVDLVAGTIDEPVNWQPTLGRELQAQAVLIAQVGILRSRRMPDGDRTVPGHQGAFEDGVGRRPAQTGLHGLAAQAIGLRGGGDLP